MKDPGKLVDTAKTSRVWAREPGVHKIFRGVRAGDQASLIQLRIDQIAAQSLMVRAVTDHLADVIADGGDAASIAHQIVLTRDSVETCATGALAIVERSGGMAAHREGSDLDSIRRDLGL